MSQDAGQGRHRRRRSPTAGLAQEVRGDHRRRRSPRRTRTRSTSSSASSRVGLTVFALIALIVGAFIIYNTFSIVVAQRLREMALLRAIGASRRQVLGSVIGESFAVGVIASAIGRRRRDRPRDRAQGAAERGRLRTPGQRRRRAAERDHHRLHRRHVVTLISSIVPARQAARIPPIAAMRSVALERPLNRVAAQRDRDRRSPRSASRCFSPDCSAARGIARGRRSARCSSCSACSCSARCSHAGLALAIGAPLTKIKGVTGSLARENAARNPRRTATTGAAVMIAVSLVGFITIFAASANASISAAIDQQLKTDYIITSGSSGNGAPAGLSPDARPEDRRAARDPGGHTGPARPGRDQQRAGRS